MPLKALMESYDRPDARFEPVVLRAGELAVWIDKSEIIGRLVIAKCSGVDMGGSIYVAEEPEKIRPGLTVVTYDDGNLYENIPPGMDSSIDYIDQDDEQMRLIFQHEFPGGRISSDN